MTISEILANVLSMDGAQMGRVNKTNFVIIPVEDGYAKVEIKTALAKDTANRSAFNAEAAKAEYKAWEAERALRLAEKANKPVKVKGPNPEAQARRDELDAAIVAMPSFVEMTATDIANAVKVSFNVNPMLAGSAAKRLVEKGILAVTTRENDAKSYYTKA